MYKRLDSKKVEERNEILSSINKKDLFTNHSHFNFNIEDIEKSLKSGFVEIPENLDSFEDFDLWLKNVVK